MGDAFRIPLRHQDVQARAIRLEPDVVRSPAQAGGVPSLGTSAPTELAGPGVVWDVEHPGRGARAIADGVIVMTGIPRDEAVDVAALDAAVGKVRAGLPSWVALPVEEKAGLVHRLRRRFGDEAPGMVEDWRVAQGLEPDSHWMGDVWAGLVRSRC